MSEAEVFGTGEEGDESDAALTEATWDLEQGQEEEEAEDLVFAASDPGYPLYSLILDSEGHTCHVALVADYRQDGHLLLGEPFVIAAVPHQALGDRKTGGGVLLKKQKIQLPARDYGDAQVSLQDFSIVADLCAFKESFLKSVEPMDFYSTVDLSFMDVESSVEAIPFGPALLIARDKLVKKLKPPPAPLPTGGPSAAAGRRRNGQEAEPTEPLAGRKPALKREKKKKEEEVPVEAPTPDVKALEQKLTELGQLLSSQPLPGITAALSPEDTIPPEVAKQAAAAGISEEALATMRVLFKKPSRLQDAPGSRGPTAKAALREAAEEEAAILEEPGGDQMSQILHRMTSVMEKLTEGSSSTSAPKTVAQKLEGLFQSSPSGALDSSTALRQNAAQRSLLQKAMSEEPEYIFTTFDKLVFQQMRDFVSVSHGPAGASKGRVPLRSYLQFKARVGGHYPSLLWIWLAAGAYEALSDEDVNQARARLAMMIIAMEQASIDAGNLALAQELCFDNLPPTPQGSAAADADPWPATCDPRWADIAIRHLKERESWKELKSKLSGKKKPLPLEDGKPQPKPKAKTKAKAKAKGKGAQADGEEEN